MPAGNTRVEEADDIQRQDDIQPTSVKEKVIKVHPMALIGLFQENNKVGVKEGIPAGTKFVGGGYDAATNCFFFHVENPRFPETEVGERLPALDIVLVDLNVHNMDGTEVEERE